ncbi:MAG TPA: hypothetical protein VG710_18355 [Opitutus sp.]|nr:hypothetical protein [Opitutus sp.]
MKRFRQAAALRRVQAAFAALTTCHRRRVALRGTRFSFTISEIDEIDRRLTKLAKIAQSDVPDNMLALLSALRASAGLR